jgi:hypothetical protein
MRFGDRSEAGCSISISLSARLLIAACTCGALFAFAGPPGGGSKPAGRGLAKAETLDVFRWSLARSARRGRREPVRENCTVYPRHVFFLGGVRKAARPLGAPPESAG